VGSHEVKGLHGSGIAEKLMNQAELIRKTIAIAVENVRAESGGPFGALVVREGSILATGANAVTSANDPTAHAEIVAIRQACRAIANCQLKGCDHYCPVKLQGARCK
jgi:guanine deaminase